MIRMKNIAFVIFIAVNLLVGCQIKVQHKNAAIINKEEKIIRFSGYDWLVRNPKTRQEPHNNYWNGDNVWLDKNGDLHLKLTKNTERNIWECAELRTLKKFGYGTYQWKVKGPVNSLDMNIVLGFFNYSGNNEFDEMDIEFSRWGYTHAPILNYTVWPAEKGKDKNVTDARDFAINKNQKTTHRWTRDSTSIYFQSLHGYQNKNKKLFADKKWSVPTSISKLEMPVFMNLWLFKTTGPSDQKEVEIIVHEFKFTPIR